MKRKDISSLSVDISNYGERVIDNLIKAQSNTAFVIQQDAKYLAPKDTGKYRQSIKLGETTYDGSHIKTSVYTNATVSSYAGKTYNLGRLLEEGTSPHEIRAVKKRALFWGGYDDEGNPIIVTKVLHPGMIAQPHMIPALQRNIALYKTNIRKALKEAE